MEKRTIRIRHKRKKERQKLSKSFPTAIAVSSLLISGISQISGETYASFNDKEGLSGQVKACEVFPKHIESQFNELIIKVEELSSLSKDFHDYKKKEFNFSHTVTITGDSIEELEKSAISYSTKIETYQAKKSSIQYQKRVFSQKKALILKKVEEIYQLAREMGIYSQYDRNCTTIDKAIIHKKLTEQLNDSLLLTSLTRNSITGLLDLFYSENGHTQTKQAKSSIGGLSSYLEKDINTVVDDVLDDLTKAGSDIDQEIERLAKLEKNARKKVEEKKQKIKEEAASEEEKEATEESSEVIDEKTTGEKDTTTETTEPKKKENTQKDQEKMKQEKKDRPATKEDKTENQPAEKQEKKKEPEPAKKSEEKKDPEPTEKTEEKKKSNPDENKDPQSPPPVKDEEETPNDGGENNSKSDEIAQQ